MTPSNNYGPSGVLDKSRREVPGPNVDRKASLTARAALQLSTTDGRPISSPATSVPWYLNRSAVFPTRTLSLSMHFLGPSMSCPGLLSHSTLPLRPWC